MDNWYLNRLKTMSVPEVFYRAGQTLRGVIEERFVANAQSKPHDNVSFVRMPGIVLDKTSDIPYSIKIFGTEFNFSNPSLINWHSDIISGKAFPVSFYKKINIRKDPGLSAKCVWEVNRMQYLSIICRNYKSSGRESDLNLFMDIIKSWTDHNPYLMGVNWYSNIEVNLRLITWFLCWEILDADSLVDTNLEFGRFAREIWLPQIEKHCIYSFRNPSKYSSANNHLISEYAGLFIAASKWKFSDSEKWIRYSHHGLEREISRQHSYEGINKEEAAEYIQFITDFFLLAFIVAEKTNHPFSERYSQKLFKIFCYIYNMLDCNGNFPKYGDEDDGKCFLLDADQHFNNFRSLLTSGAIIFRNPVLKSKSNGFDIKNQFLFGEAGREEYEKISVKEKPQNSVFYYDDGHFFFRKNEGNNEILMHFDAAPLGYLSIAAHGHADALSMILNVDGQGVFVDPGTYTYHTEPEWRSYFIGTLCHNTVRINNRDQALSGGPTLWLKQYKTKVLDLDLNKYTDHVTATHNGYNDNGVQHIRKINFNRLKNEFEILDSIIVLKKRLTDIEIPFHVHPGLNLLKNKNHFVISGNNMRNTEFYIDEKLDPQVIKGQTEPQILGWYSDSFLKKEATSVIYCKTQIDCSTSFKFVIKIK